MGIMGAGEQISIHITFERNLWCFHSGEWVVGDTFLLPIAIDFY